jgi:hypothetical protein
MKKQTLIFLFLLTMLKMQGQDFVINFTGTGSSSIVDSVLVENLTQGTSISFDGNNELYHHLCHLLYN